MMRHALGGTGIEVSALGLGTVKLGRNTALRYPQAFELPNARAAARLLDTARELGINLLDTAPAYGSSEERLGTLLRGRRRDWVLCTKTGEEFDGERSRHDFTPAHTRASVQRSLRRLGTDCLDIVLLHAAGDEVAILHESGALEALRTLQREGLVRAVGISVKTLEGGLAAAACCDVVMLEYSLLAPAQEPVLRECARSGRGVLVKKALGSGQLCSADGARRAMEFACAAPGVGSVLVGTLDPAHLAANVAACTAALAGAARR